MVLTHISGRFQGSNQVSLMWSWRIGELDGLGGGGREVVRVQELTMKGR